ncbi:ATP-dependent DNA ligase [Microbacterium sp. A8/3-1]|uniref:ATP-dependent DNA ligase n=1 Tax=Microbacterium sp. A8/3-1 TaxID=3160749 RepID=A0AAU7W1Z0_9MICO
MITGKFIYEGNVKVEFPDRALAHLQLAITTKIRRAEPFAFSWKEDVSTGGGRTIVWIHPGSSLVFKWEGSQPSTMDRTWVEALILTASSPSSLYLVPEPAKNSPAAE